MYPRPLIGHLSPGWPLIGRVLTDGGPCCVQGCDTAVTCNNDVTECCDVRCLNSVVTISQTCYNSSRSHHLPHRCIDSPFDLSYMLE